MRTLTVVICLSGIAASAAGTEPVSFNRQIRPILSNKCFACHGPGAGDRKGNLRLDVPDGAQGALMPREGTAIIRGGQPDESELWRRIAVADEGDRMPPAESHKEPLTAEELALVRQWIMEGGEYQPFWSFIPPRKAPPATPADSAWGSGPIDSRVMARLEKEALRPNEEADRRTLLRRVTFDLTGLPPTLEEIDAFLSDESPDAYARVVDGLLARETYGEHMARYWADLVRLADTNGMHKDFHRDFTTYRDWLIRSFNENLPFDDFLKYQLAGDLYEEPSRDQLIASGFNRLHLIIDVGTALPEESLHKNVLDRVEAFGTAFLGLTVHCAQCHDHKYDPISQKEFFEIYAFFNNFSGEPETGRNIVRGLQEPFIYLTEPEEEQQLAALAGEREPLNAALAKLRENLEAPAAATTAPESAAVENAETAATGVARIAKEIEKEIESLDEEKAAILGDVPGAMIMSEMDPPRQATILIRGAYDAPGEPVERGTPAVLPSLPEKDTAYTRMDLAEWLVRPDHPLTARVAVNRIWQQFFGVGLVKTSEDFGAQGEWPSHPDLLDDLSIAFVDSGWDLKRLVREIVLSNTYRQRSDVTPEGHRRDPQNRLLARGPRYRMDAEMIRDQILAVSGQLNPAMYGRSVKPPQPPGLWEMVSMAEPMTYVADEGDKIYRRSLYTYWRRGMPPPQMTILNAPSREFCVARRERTNTPLQALLLMNEEEFFRAATMCAKAALAEAMDPGERASLLYEKITSQVPEAARVTYMLDTLAGFREIYRADPALTESLTPDMGESELDARVELSAWTMLTHSLLNLELAKVKR